MDMELSPLFLLAIIGLIIQQIRLSRRLTRMSDELNALRRALAPTPVAPPTAVAPKPAAETVPAPSTPAPMFPPAPARTAPPPKSRSRAELEALVGGKVLNRIGALAVVLAAAFFLKYAFDNNLISEGMRVAIGAVAGVGLAALGIRFERKGMKIFAQGLIGAGIAILYLTVYAALNLYHLVPGAAAFLLSAAVTAATLAYAKRAASTAILALGWIGGYLMPVVLHTGHPDMILFFSYLTALNIGMMWMAASRASWALVEIPSVIVTYLYFFDVHSSLDNPGAFMSMTVLAVVWGVFHGAWVKRIAAGTEKELSLAGVAAILNALLFYNAMPMVLRPEGITALPIGYACAAVAYAAAAAWLTRRSTVRGMWFAGHVIIVAAFAAASSWEAFERYPFVLALSIEAIALAWFARAVRHPLSRLLAGAVYVAAILAYLSLDESMGFLAHDALVSFVTWRTAAMLALVATGVASSKLAYEENDAEHALRRLFGIVPILLAGFWIMVQCGDMLTGPSFEHAAQSLYVRNLLVSLLIVAEGFAIMRVFGQSQRELALTGVGVMLTGVIALACVAYPFGDMASYAVVFNVRVLVLALTVAVMIATMIFVPTSLGPLRIRVHQAAGGIAVLTILAVVTMECYDAYVNPIAQAMAANDDAGAQTLRDSQQLALSIGWICYGAALVAFGFWRRVSAMRVAGIALLGVSVVKIVVVDLSYLPLLPRIFSFLVLGVILLAVSYAYQKFRVRIG